jgi:N-acetyl-anhydromuramyl-L-alanine amidase AmpD
MFNKKWLPSPFFKSRGNFPLDMVVIHHIGSQNKKLYSVGGTLTWFTNEEVHRNKQTGKIENKVSAHYVIPRETHKGNDLYHLVKDEDIAYHAGVSQWTVNDKLRKYINRYSIGIELEGDGNIAYYTDFQYEVLTWLIKDIISKYDIKEQNIVGHEDIAPGRKVDPGKFFDWKKLRSKLSPPIIIHDKGSITSPIQISMPEIFIQPVESEEDKKNTSKVENEKFFMSDGSKTDNTFVEIIKKILSLFSIIKF